MSRTLEYPFTMSKVKTLKLGQKVSLSGVVYTGRDRFHRYLCQGGKSPVNLTDGAIFHAGPITIKKEGKWHVVAAGPTTSARMDAYMPKILEQHRVRIIIGKGGMGEATRLSCAKYGCVYLEAIGGTAACLAQCVKEVKGVFMVDQFGEAEAVWAFIVKGLKAVVAIDAMGRSLHNRVKQSSKRVLRKLVSNLG